MQDYDKEKNDSLDLDTTYSCSHCNYSLEKEDKFCPRCGNSVDSIKTLSCSQCGGELNRDENFCSKCGTKVIGNSPDKIYTNISDTSKPINSTDKKKKKLIIIGVIAAVFIAFILISQNSGYNLEKIYNNLNNTYYCRLSSDKKSLTIDTNPLDLDNSFSSEAWKMIKDVNKQLKLPESLNTKMEQTRALDGRQSEDYGNITVSWTYHPNRGIQVMYEKK